MSIELTLWTEVDLANDAAELFVRFKTCEFSGRASAWFKLAQVKQFATDLARYPLAKGSTATLAGGFWDTTGNRIVQEHVYISVEPSGNLGALSLCVRLAENGDQSKIRYSASANIMTEYPQVSELAEGLTALANGMKKEISFTFAEK